MTKRSAETEIKRKAVWADEDDHNSKIEVPKLRKSIKDDLVRPTDDDTLKSEDYTQRLQTAFKKRHGGSTPAWAQSRKKEEDEDEESGLLTKSAGDYIEKDSFLPKTTISTTLIRDFNIAHKSTRPINVVRFHKTRPVLITADEAGTVQLFKVDSEVKKDNFLQSSKFTKFPIHSMEIFEKGQSVLCSSSTQEYLMSYNMEKSKAAQHRLPNSIPKQGINLFSISPDGQILAIAGHNFHVYLLAANVGFCLIFRWNTSKTISLPSNATDLKFAPGFSRELWVMTEDGQVVIADARGSSQHTFVDDGAVHGTRIALSNHGDYVATGSDTGIVNVYDGLKIRDETTPKPLFAVDSLTTAISSVSFSSDAQMVAITSNVKVNQLRLVHLRSKTVFKNFPLRHDKVTSARSTDFSPNSGYLAVGCDDGKLNLFRIEFFKDY
ncbi:unnamed protein product [Caenorhabditis auriculariae]|uniref:U3 small nucleolar RNA-associated protein 18 n=1 Tax=Caenorhabditis auriculariae TaxID=2777116 RepID=A0A8S1H4V8_9PELO|nr:unnamed protein product [Caenorhabditis auriculariae]